MATLNHAANLFQVGINQAVNLMLANRARTTMVQGHMGSGKSTLLKILAKRLPNHIPTYFDGTTKDLGDMSLPILSTVDTDGYVKFVPNEELGIHLGKPVILMFDEFGKMNPAVKNATLRIMQEREFAGYKLHKDSIVFCTTNLGAEGVGDVLPPHARNRMTILKMRKSTNVEWIEDFAIDAGIDPILMACVQDKPEWFQSFEDVKDPKDNEAIYHPMDKSRTSFVTNRSLHAASDWLLVRDQFDTASLQAALIGTIGAKAAAELTSFVTIGDQMPSLDSIKKSPLTATIPSSPVACSMVCYRTLSTIERNWSDSWMDYLVRMPREYQMMFAMQVRRKEYQRQSEIMTNSKYMKWCLENNFAFNADKK